MTDVAGCNDTCADTFAVDNLKLWNYAKTDFSDRFKEGSSPAPGLLLWNKLGSADEVTHSAYGPGLVFFDCRDRAMPYFLERCEYDIPGTLAYPFGVFAGAARITTAPPNCRVPAVKKQTLPTATRTLSRAHCRVGRILRAYSETIKRGHVIAVRPRPGKVLPNRSRVVLIVSRGRRPS